MKLPATLSSLSVDSYHRHRMLLGVAEGTNEVVPEKALPFDFNLDYMNGGKEFCLCSVDVVCLVIVLIECFENVSVLYSELF